MDYKKIIKPVTLVSAALLGTYLLARNGSKEDIKKLADTGKEIAKKVPESVKTFGKITLEELNEIVADTPRGVKVEIDGDTLRYFFKSASGKSTPTANYKLDENGQLVNTFMSYIDAKSPRFFEEKLMQLLKLKNDLKGGQ